MSEQDAWHVDTRANVSFLLGPGTMLTLGVDLTEPALRLWRKMADHLNHCAALEAENARLREKIDAMGGELQ